MKTVNLNAAYFPAVELLSAFVTSAILLYGGLQAIQGEVTIGVLVAFIAALNNFFDPIQQLSQLYTTYQAGMAALDKIFELLDEEPELRDRPARSRCRGCAASWRSRTSRSPTPATASRALDGIDLHVPAGQTVALVGSTGAGKSTFAKLAARFYDPTEGRILVDGHDLRDVQARSLRAQMGIVPQEAFLFSGTIRDNLAFGRPDATLEEIEAAARAVGAHDFIAALEHGYDTRGRRARGPALGGPAPAGRVHARADRRPAHPRARRGDLERRHPHRGPDRGGHAAAARRPHRDRDRAPPLDDPPRRPHRRARRTAGSPSRARTTSCSTPRAPTGACTATGPSRPRRRERRAAARARPNATRAGWGCRRSASTSDAAARAGLCRRRAWHPTAMSVGTERRGGGLPPSPAAAHEPALGARYSRLAGPHARIQPGVDRVREEVREHDEQRRLDDQRLDEVDVAVDQRPLDVAEAARDVEDRLDQREVREDQVHVHADERDDRPGGDGERVAPDDAAPPHSLAARGAHEVLVQGPEQLRGAHARACGRERGADDQRRQPEPVQEAQRVVERVAIAVDGREEPHLGDGADAGREQQQRDEPEPVDRRGERERGRDGDRARRERARAGRLDRAGGQPREHAQHERGAEQVAVDEEAVHHDVQRRARADERLVLEVAAADVAAAGTRPPGSGAALPARPAALSGRPGSA